jgi:short-subunit dehydrogenase involved in D-alanine esterification of teichoic acids
VAAATRAFTDVNLLINNAGICHWSGIYLNYDPARDLETAA